MCRYMINSKIKVVSLGGTKIPEYFDKLTLEFTPAQLLKLHQIFVEKSLDSNYFQELKAMQEMALYFEKAYDMWGAKEESGEYEFKNFLH